MAKQTKGGTNPKAVKTIKTKGGGSAQVSERSVSDARSNRGAFQERPAYKGKTIKAQDGSVTGIKKHDGTFVRTTGPVERRKAAKELEYDKKLHKTDSIAHSRTIKSFQNPLKAGK